MKSGPGIGLGLGGGIVSGRGGSAGMGIDASLSKMGVRKANARPAAIVPRNPSANHLNHMRAGKVNP